MFELYKGDAKYCRYNEKEDVIPMHNVYNTIRYAVQLLKLEYHIKRERGAIYPKI